MCHLLGNVRNWLDLTVERSLFRDYAVWAFLHADGKAPIDQKKGFYETLCPSVGIEYMEVFHAHGKNNKKYDKTSADDRRISMCITRLSPKGTSKGRMCDRP